MVEVIFFKLRAHHCALAECTMHIIMHGTKLIQETVHIYEH